MAGSGSAVRAGRAFVELFADDSKLVRGLQSAQKKLQSWGTSINTIGAGFLAGGGAVLGGIATAALTFANVGSDLKDMSDRTGASVESLSAFSYAAGQTGAAGEDVEAGIRKMQKSLVEAAGGSAEANQALSKIGLTFAQLRGMKPEDQFRAISKGIAATPNAANRTAVAMALMGKSATKLLPMMQQLGDLEKEAGGLGVILSTEDADKADALGDAFSRLKASVMGVVMQIGSAVAPAFTMILDFVTPIVGAISSWIKQNKTVVLTVAAVAAGVMAAGIALVGIGTAFIAMGAAITGAIVVVKAVIATFALLFSWPVLIGGALVALAGYFIYTSGVWKGWIASFKAGFSVLKDDALKAFGAIRDALSAGDIGLAFKAVVALLKVEWLRVSGLIMTKWTEVKNFVLSVWDEASGNIAVFFINSLAVIEEAWTKTIGFVRNAWFDMAATFADPILEALGAAMKASFALKNAFGLITDEEMKVFSSMTTGLVEGFKKSVPLLLTEARKRADDEDEVALNTIETNRRGAVGEVGKMNDNARSDRDKQAQADMKKNSAAILDAEMELDSLQLQAKQAAAEAAKKKAAKVGEAAEAGVDSAKKDSITASGSFLASSVRGLGGGSALDRTARATEATAAAVKEVRDKIEAERAG